MNDSLQSAKKTMLKHRRVSFRFNRRINMSLQDLITEKLQNTDKATLAKQLDYNNVSKFEKRLQESLQSKYLGLDNAYYDFNLTTKEFVQKLCTALEIPALLYKQVVSEISAELLKEKEPKPYFFLETNFKRDNQPIFALAAMQGERFLSVNRSIYQLPLNEQLEKLSSLVRVHFNDFPKFWMWGEIKSYVYFYNEDTVIIFSTDGEVIEACDHYDYSRAVMSLK